jgi:hypothetical protein
MVVHALGEHEVAATVEGGADPLEPQSAWVVVRDEDYDRARSAIAGPARGAPRREPSAGLNGSRSSTS